MSTTTKWKVGDAIDGRWEIHQILSGGMGWVYIVYDREWAEPFAAKTFQDQVLAQNPGAANRFVSEARAWTNLDQHENVVHARFVQQIDGKPFLFLEYVSGGDLSSWIAAKRLQNDVPLVLRFAIQFCDGMIHANSKGIQVHRDIKPQNCLVTESGVLKVTDFGLAKALDDVPGSDNASSSPRNLTIGVTHTGSALGTCTHMAPEQFDNAKGVATPADIYSFGITMFQMLTGNLPFAGNTWREFESLHKRQPIPRIASLDSHLSKILERCVAKNANERFQTFASLRQELSRMFERITGQTAPTPKVGRELDAYSLVNKGVSLKQLGRIKEADVCYDKALSLEPRMAEAWSNKGSLRGASGEYREAVECYNRGLKINPRLPQAWFNKGIALSALGANKEAISCFENAHTLNPHDDNAWYCKAIALSRIGRNQDAILSSERCVQLNPANANAWFNMGALLGTLGETRKAISCYEWVINLKPDETQAWFNLAQARGILGQFEASIEACNRAISLKPNDGDAWFMKGVGLARLHRYGEAIDCFKRAERLGHIHAHSALVDCERKLNH